MKDLNRNFSKEDIHKWSINTLNITNNLKQQTRRHIQQNDYYKKTKTTGTKKNGKKPAHLCIHSGNKNYAASVEYIMAAIKKNQIEITI